MLVQNLSGLADLQKCSLDFIPGLAANSDEGLEAKEGEQLEIRLAEGDRLSSISARYPLQRHRSLLSPALLA